MKIGELFIALGFQVEGLPKLDDTDRKMRGATINAGALALAVNSVNYAFLRMVEGARGAAVEFKNFALATGLSADELKKWQQAAEINDVTAKEMTDTVKNLQGLSAEVRLGRGNIAPFQLLGISPNQDPFTILRQLRERIKELPPDIARVIAGQMGISDNIFQMLRQATVEFDRLEERYRLTAQEQTALIRLNRAWKDLIFSVKSLRDKFASDFAPVLTMITKGLKAATDAAAAFVHWLGQGSTAATVIRGVLIALMLGFFALGLVLAGIAAALAAITVAMGILTVAASPVIVALTSIGLVIGGLIAAFVYAALVIQDFWTAAEGGKSRYDWNDGLLLTIKNVDRLAKALETVVGWWTKLKAIGTGMAALAGSDAYAADLAHSMAARAARGSSSVRQENNVRVMVDGARSPEETAKAVADSVTDAVADAAYQMPVPNY